MRRYGTPGSVAWYENEVVPDRWSLLREIGKETLSSEAQLKLEWIIFYNTVGKENAVKTAKHFGINPKTLHKWKKRFNEKNLSSVEEHSRAPEKTRMREITGEQRTRIRALRKRYIRWGKMKLQKRYIALHKENISSWKIQKVIEEEQLYYDKKKARKEKLRRKQAKRQQKKRITEFVKEHKLHHLWHVDTVVFTLTQGGYRYLLTAIDDYSKLAYARLYTTHSSKQAADFLRRLHYLTEGEMINLHHDNGSEFKKDFEKACAELSLPQWYSRTHTPKDNAVLERFNRTIQEEFVDLTDVGLEGTLPFNQRLTDWLEEYNLIRPHQSLDYLSPLDYIDHVLPMSSSRTRI
jgi:putative transposase